MKNFNLNYQTSLSLLLEGKEVREGVLTQGLITEHQIISKLLEENKKEDIHRYIREKIITPVEKFYKNTVDNIGRLSKSIANSIIKGISSVFSLIKRFTKAYPKMTKVIISLILIIVLMLAVGAVSAYASSGGDLSDLQQLATTTEAGPILDGIYGLIAELEAGLAQTYGQGVVIETKGLVMDLKDGVVNISDFSNQAKEIGDAVLRFFQDTVGDAKLGDESALSNVQRWIENGTELINKSTIRLTNVTVSPDGSIAPR